MTDWNVQPKVKIVWDSGFFYCPHIPDIPDIPDISDNVIEEFIAKSGLKTRKNEEVTMTDEQKLTFLLKVLKKYAEMKHCYERDRFYDVYDERDLSEIVEHAEEYATIHFARTILEQIGVEFEYPVMKKND